MKLAACLLLLATSAAAASDDRCRPDGMIPTAGVNTPYCLAYDGAGREKMGPNARRVIGYFASWRNGAGGTPAYLVSNIPWPKLTHINYAFAHVDDAWHLSVGDESDPQNPATGMQWPGVAGAEMDPALPYKGHFNLLTKYKRQYPNVKTLISVGGWAETGGYFGSGGNRVGNGGFYTLTVDAAGNVNTAAINTFADSAVAFLRRFGFDGLDIDYEYPTTMNNSGNPLDFATSNARRAKLMAGYVQLMKTLREKLDAASAQDARYYLLSIAAPSSGYLLRGMETFPVTGWLDYVNVMTYDLHGSWNAFVGPNAALYDDGADAELAHWSVYTTPQYGQLGYLNTDWAYHYFRGALQPGRINLGLPFYTRGWRGVSGGTHGLWGSAALPNQSQCPAGTGAAVGSSVPCGNGAIGIDNLWHDTENGAEVAAGSNPMWHAKNLEHNITPSYLATWGLTPATDPDDRVTGTYTRYYDATLVAPWLWNAAKQVFLSTEDEESLGTKAQYVVDRGIGGVMFWELSGDYGWDAAHGEYRVGTTLVDLLWNRLHAATPYATRRANRVMPAATLAVEVSLVGFALGDNNYPINPKLHLVNHSAQTLAGGSVLEFDYPTAAPGDTASDRMHDQSGYGMAVTQVGHSGNNAGGLDGDFHHVSVALPGWQSAPPGGSIDIDVVYYLPIAGPSNFTLTIGGTAYTLASEHLNPGSDVIFADRFE